MITTTVVSTKVYLLQWCLPPNKVCKKQEKSWAHWTNQPSSISEDGSWQNAYERAYRQLVQGELWSTQVSTTWEGKAFSNWHFLTASGYRRLQPLLLWFLTCYRLIRKCVSRCFPGFLNTNVQPRKWTSTLLCFFFMLYLCDLHNIREQQKLVRADFMY